MFALMLKDEYREKIIPLVDKSLGTFTCFYLFRDIQTSFGNIDSSFFDPSSIPVFDDYYNPTQWVIDEETKWWKNLDDFCKQASRYDITVVPSLFDFCCSPSDPFINHLPFPYQYPNWDPAAQGKYVKTVTEHIEESGAEYIINLGVRQYGDNSPASGWLRNLVLWLVEECGIPSNKLAMSNSLYEMNPYCHFRMLYDDNPPPNDQVNTEEFVDGHYGGTGRVAVYDEDGNLIDGYVKYIQDSGETGVPVMNTWKMSEFISDLPVGMPVTHDNAMNYIFAPRQREAMRIVLDDPEQNDGFIDFT
jgi:hypothetical protein